MIPLEDTYLDIIKKAAVGHGLGEKKIAELSQIPIAKITDFLMGLTVDRHYKQLLKFST